jgi:hypothetical protein
MSRFSAGVRTSAQNTGQIDRLQRRQRPVQPAVDSGARPGRGGIDLISLAIGEVEIAHDRIGFPQHVVAVDQRRHPPVGVHREIFGLVVLAERHAGIDAPVGQVEFGQAPQHFLNIDRIGPAPDRQLALLVVRHAFSLPNRLLSVHSGCHAGMRAPSHRGLPAADAICIGYEVRDGEAARQAVIDFGAVSWGYARLEALRRTSPVLVFDSVEDIAQLI